jgi:DnaJ homolog subfamily C member 3
MTAHPDKGGSEAKMAAVNEAYEVLSKPGTVHHVSYQIKTNSSSLLSFLDLRRRFDAGEDPNDPMAGAGGPGGGGYPGGHPFAQFFQQGSGGFQFHYSHGH